MQKRIMSIDFEYDFDSDSSTKGLNFVPKILDLFDDYDVKATFFVVGRLAEPFEDLIKEINKKHEIASHSYSHVRLDKLTKEQLDKEIKLSKESLKEIGVGCKGFRAPFLMINNNLGEMLKKYNFQYDSSISSFFPGRFYNINTPKVPYQASTKLTTKGNDFIELPVPDFTFLRFPPSALSYYRLFHPLSKSFKIPYMFYFHPHEFIENPDKKNLPIFVRQLSSRNSGKKAWSLLKNIIEKQDTKWVSCEDYVKLFLNNKI